jgi:hypothetical protein
VANSALYSKLLKRYGNPMDDPKGFQAEWMQFLNLSLWITTHIPALPNRLYLNKDIAPVMEDTLKRIISLQAYREIYSFDGLFNIRMVRGSKTKLSLHSFGIAIDINAANNPLGLTKKQAIDKGLTPFSNLFDEIWKDAGWTLGIDFSRPDGMHREYTQHL